MRQHLFWLALVSGLAMANQSDRYHQEVQAAKNSIGASLGSPTFNAFDENAYCADATCREQIQNPDQSQYFGNPNGMEYDGMLGLTTDPNASNIVDGFNDRPKYDIDPSDPALQRASGYMADSYNISHGISSKYHDCEDDSVCNYTPVDKVCSVPTDANTHCESNAVADAVIDDIGQQDFVAPIQYGTFITFPSEVSVINEVTISILTDSATIFLGSVTKLIGGSRKPKPS